jgi:hypothetical protein
MEREHRKVDDPPDAPQAHKYGAGSAAGRGIVYLHGHPPRVQKSTIDIAEDVGGDLTPSGVGDALRRAAKHALVEVDGSNVRGKLTNHGGGWFSFDPAVTHAGQASTGGDGT